MKADKRKIFNIVGGGLTLCALIFIVQAVMSFDVEISGVFTNDYIIPIILSIVSTILVVMLACFGWMTTLGFFSGVNVRFVPAFHVYAKSNMGRYIPGNIGHIIGRQLFGSSLGMTQAQLVTASVFEICYLFASALFLSSFIAYNQLYLVLSFFPSDNMHFFVILLIVIIVGTVAIIALHKRNHLRYFTSLIKGKTFWLLVIKVITLCSCSFLLNGIVYVLVMRVSVLVSINDIMIIIAAWVISWLVSYVSPGVPGGIGVREAMLVFILAPFFPVEAVLIAAILQRITSIIGDVIAWIIGAGLIYIHQNQGNNDHLP
jgi:uncharacterized membrane protein YbhN (UPF0104 family)